MSPVLIGVLAALGAGLLWGSAFVAPLLLPSYSPAYLTFGRYAAFGLVTLPMAWWQRHALRKLSRQDWWMAAKLSMVGNFIYYFALSSAIQLAGGPLPTLMIGTLPVVIAICANWQSRQFQWRVLAPSLVIILLGLALVNAEQLDRLNIGLTSSDTSAIQRYVLGGLIACIALAAWTWYPLKNSQWIAAHPNVNSAAWTCAQGLVTLPLAIAGLAYSMRQEAVHTSAAAVLGSTPLLYLSLMLFIGLGASWLGTYLWNIASQHTPPTLTGQLIVFETLAALAYAYAVYARWPSTQELAGIACLITGVVLGMRQLRLPVPAHT